MITNLNESSIIRDLMDLKDSVGNSEFKINNRGSIAKEANAGILQFPILTSTALSLTETTMIAKALEREFVSFVAIVTSLDSVTDAKSIEGYLQRIHQNVGSSVSNMFKESTIYSLPETKNNMIQRFREAEESTIGLLEYVVGIEADIAMCSSEHHEELSDEENLELEGIIRNKITSPGTVKAFKYPESVGINSIIIQERDPEGYTQIIPIRNESGKIIFVESFLANAKGSTINESVINTRLRRLNINLLESYVPDFNMSTLNDKISRNHNLSIGGNKYITEMYNNKTIGELLSEKGNSVVDELSGDFKPLPIANKIEREDTIIKDILRDNDVKKANELIPTTMHLKTYFKTENGEMQAVDYMIGVKAVVHPVKSESVVENLVRGTKRGKFFANAMKLTTGEISFFKDFVFAINRTKDDIKIKYKDNKWWNSLIRRKTYGKLAQLFNSSKAVVPNTTIVITMDEAEKIKLEYGIDLLKSRYVNDLMNQYFLLGFVIVDSSIEVAHFMFDGQQSFQQYSFAALERENGNSAKEVKNIMQVLGKM